MKKRPHLSGRIWLTDGVFCLLFYGCYVSESWYDFQIGTSRCSTEVEKAMSVLVFPKCWSSLIK